MNKFEKAVANINKMQEKLAHYRWLERIKSEYEEMINLIDREEDYFTIQSFTYTARGDAQTFPVNSHRSIPYTYIRDGLAAELATIEQEIEDCKKEIENDAD